jgi:hypothetical protein
MEEDDITESTGMPYDFDKLIRLADRYERHHNAAPKEELSTLFKVASGGLHTKPHNPDKQSDQLNHLKKDQFLQKKLDTLQAQIETLQTNNARPYKNEGRQDRARQARRQDRSDSQRRARESSTDRNRDLIIQLHNRHMYHVTHMTETDLALLVTVLVPHPGDLKHLPLPPMYRSHETIRALAHNLNNETAPAPAHKTALQVITTLTAPTHSLARTPPQPMATRLFTSQLMAKVTLPNLTNRKTRWGPQPLLFPSTYIKIY